MRKSRLNPADLELFLEELDLVGFQPEALTLSPKQQDIFQRADERALEASLRTIKNSTYQGLGLPRRAGILRKIFARHRRMASLAIGEGR